MQSFSFKGQDRPPMEYMRAELILCMIDGIDGIHFSTWDGGVPHHAVNSPEMQAYLKLFFNLEERIYQACNGENPRTLAFESTSEYVSGAQRGNLVLLANLSENTPAVVRFKAAPGSLQDFLDLGACVEYKNGFAEVKLPPWGVAVWKRK